MVYHHNKLPVMLRNCSAPDLQTIFVPFQHSRLSGLGLGLFPIAMRGPPFRTEAEFP